MSDLQSPASDRAPIADTPARAASVSTNVMRSEFNEQTQALNSCGSRDGLPFQVESTDEFCSREQLLYHFAVI